MQRGIPIAMKILTMQESQISLIGSQPADIKGRYECEAHRRRLVLGTRWSDVKLKQTGFRVVGGDRFFGR